MQEYLRFAQFHSHVSPEFTADRIAAAMETWWQRQTMPRAMTAALPSRIRQEDASAGCSAQRASDERSSSAQGTSGTAATPTSQQSVWSVARGSAEHQGTNAERR